jgi:hypothetical protein
LTVFFKNVQKNRTRPVARHNRPILELAKRPWQGGLRLLHHQHLARPFDRAAEQALIMRRQTRVFAGQQPTRVSHILPEQIHIFEIDGVDGEIDLGLGPQSTMLHTVPARTPPILAFFRIRFAWHNLLDFPMHRATAQKWIVFFDLDLFRLQLFVA